MRVVFFGTPEFAVPSLDALAGRHEVVAVVSQPDRARDRKGNLLLTPVKAAAERLGIPVYQFASVKKEGAEILRSLNADIFVTAGYGQILNEEILSIPPLGVINVHASLLPKYRGSSPIQWAIINGETVTGVSIMRTELGLDTGDVILADSIEIGENETAGELTARLKNLGAELLLKALTLIETGAAKYIPQNDAEATKCQMISRETGRIDWSKSAREINNLIRGLNPAPSAFSYLGGEYVKIFAAEIVEETSRGKVGEVDGEMRVACGSGSLKLLEVQPQNKRRMTAAQFAAGRKITGEVFE